MVEAAGPTRLLEVCGQRLSRFLRDAEHKRLAWLREVEAQGMRMLESNLGAEPGPVARTPSQRRRSRKRQSCYLKDYSKEPSRRRLSRRRSSIKLASSKPGSQRRQGKEQPLDPGCGGEGAQACAAAALPALPGAGAGAGAAEAPGPSRAQAGFTQHCPAGACALPPWEQSPRGPAASEWQDEAPPVTAVRAGPAARTSIPAAKAAGAGAAGEPLPPGRGSRGARRCAGRRSSLGAPPAGSRRASGSRRAMARKAARESSIASSRASCQSSREAFVEEDVAGMRPGLELDPTGEGAPEDALPSSTSTLAASSPAQRPPAPEQWAGSDGGTPVNPNSESQNKDQEPSPCAGPQEDPPCIWTRSRKQAMGAVWKRQQRQQQQQQQPPGAQAPSPLGARLGSPAEPSSGAGSSKVVRSLLRAVQRHPLLPSAGPPRPAGVVRSLLQRSAGPRPSPKGDFVEKERQRLESLRKKQEAEEQRKKKMEEEKRQRQAEMKQKREERLRKALQARERAEEEKKKRMEQKILQSDEKVRDREEKAEERVRKKLSKKSGEAEARKQKALKGENELEQERREDEVKGKGKKVLELKSLLEQQQAEHGKERDHRHGGKEKPPHPQLGAAAFPEKHRKQEEAGLQRPAERKVKQPEAPTAAAGTGLGKTLKKSISAPYLKSLKGTEQSSHPRVSEDNYGMDQNSDDATDDESDPRKPVPAWADGPRLKQGIMHQYYHPVNTDQLFGLISGLRLEEIFGKSKPRYFKRTSSAVWHSPPRPRSTSSPSCSLSK